MADPMIMSEGIDAAVKAAKEAQEEVESLIAARDALLNLETVWYGPNEDIPECPDGWFTLWCPIVSGAVGYVRPPEMVLVNGDNDIQNGYASEIVSHFGQRMSYSNVVLYTAKATAYLYAELVAKSISDRVLNLVDE